MRRFSVLSMIALAMALLLGACGGGGSDSASSDTTPSQTSCDDVDLSTPPAQPVKINYGRGLVADEPIWVLEANPSVTPNQGKWYDISLTPFRSVEDRFTGFQAGELQGFTGNPPAVVRAKAGDLPVTVLGTLMRESDEAFVSRFLALEGSGINSISDLKGKKIGVFDIGSDTDLAAKAAVERAGFDFQTDAEYVVLPAPAQEEALRTGQIDVATIVEPFYTQAMKKGGVVEVFDAITGPGMERDVQWVVFDSDFIDDNLAAVCAFLSDLEAATTWYNANLPQARTLFVEKQMTQSPLEVFLAAQDWLHPNDLAVSASEIDELIDQMIAFGILTEDQRVPATELFRSGVTSERS